jgi:hypothetical protein
MKRLWTVLLALLLLASLAMTVSAAPKKKAQPRWWAPNRAPFVGAWEAIDGDEDGDGDVDIEGRDGSYMRLAISNGPKGVFRFNYKDHGASVCGLDEDDEPLYAALAKGRLNRDGEFKLEGEASLKCLARPRFVHPDFDPYQVSYTYDPEDDTLFDGWVTWQRMGVLDIHP